MANTLLAIDGNSLMHRAYWALPQMHDGEGRPTNAVYGFLTMLFRIVEEYKPTHIAVAFDMHEKTFRHKQFEAYKAGRRKTPDDLNEQFVIIKDVLTMVGLGYIELPGYEADDILGTLAKHWNMQTFIFTGDRDELQLIADDTCVVLTKKGVTETKLMTPDALMEEWGIAPEQVPDLKALMGDASDNIPGVAGVGEKTALKLLHEYSTIENLYDHLDELPKNKLLEKLTNGKDSAFLSKELATICVDAPITQTADQFAFDAFDTQKLQAVFQKYSFKAFMKRFQIEQPKKREAERVQIKLDELSFLDDAVEFAFVVKEDGFYIAVDGGKEYVLPLKQNLLDDGYDYLDVLAAVRPYFEGRRVIAHDIKAHMHQMEQYDITITDYFDVMLADWVLSPAHGKYDFGAVMKRWDMRECAADVFLLSERQIAEITEKELEFILYDIETPLLHVLYDMEQNGFYVSKDALAELGRQYDAQIATLTQEIYRLAGMEFNISSPKQLAEVLFEKLELPVIKKTKTGYSTDVEVLEKLQDKHEIISYIIEYRSLTKLKGTYVDGLISLIRNGYIHTTFLQTNTATGRLSSTEPNLQNIPIRSALADDIREAFLAPEGTTIVSADYSQIELRILAHIAQDDNMKKAFMNDEDIHARTAAEILDKDIADVTKEERSNAKAVNFGIVYGISDFGLARGTGLSRKEAGRYIDRYLAEFSGVRQYMDTIKEQAHRDGFVRTMFGRIRYIPELSSGNYNIRSAGERAALNTPIQGTAADIMKIAMNNAAKALKGMRSKLVLQVHDELIVYAAEDEVEQVKQVLRQSMEQAAQLSVPLKVSIAAGQTWREAK